MAQIPLSGSVGVPGSAPILGNYNVIFTSNVSHTMSATEYSNYFLEVTSSITLSAPQNLIAPLTQGQSFAIQNNTTGGQSITIIGSSGTGVTITDGYTVAVVCDGYNYIQIGGTSATSGSFTAGGDLSGTSTDQIVTGLYTNPLASTTPSQSDVPVWDTSLSHYSIRQLTADDIGAGFTINGFSGGSTVEIGATVTNPAFTASYSHTPNSAQITNTDGIDSPLVLSSPYTSGTVVGSFDHNSQATVTFTLTAIYTSTKTATSPINWYPRSFAGVGAPGATSTVTAHAGNTAQLSTGDILANEGLLSTFVGQSVSFTASSQNLYFLLVGGSHSFTDNSNQNPFPFNSPTPVSFVNQNSQTVAMYLYQSSTTLTGTYSIKVSG
jgi:hypothetical protein